MIVVVLWDLAKAGLMIGAMVAVILTAMRLVVWVIKELIFPQRKAMTEAQARDAVRPLSSTVDVHLSSNGRTKEQRAHRLR